MNTATTPQESGEPTPQVLAGRTLRMMREAHHVGLTEMARLVGVSKSHLSRIETGERVATPELTTRICDVIAELPKPGVVA